MLIIPPHHQNFISTPSITDVKVIPLPAGYLNRHRKVACCFSKATKHRPVFIDRWVVMLLLLVFECLVVVLYV